MTRTVLLGDVVDISSSKRIFYSEYVESGVPFYRSKEIIERAAGKKDISTELFISEDRFNEIESKFGAPQQGDLLLTSVGTLGVPYLVQTTERFYFKDGNLTWFRNFKPDLDPNYLLYWLTSKDGKNELQNHTIGSTQKALTIQGLKKVKLPLPNIGTQKKIADILGTIDEKIELNRKMNETLEQMGQALFRHYFIDNLEVEGWKDGTIADLGEVITGKTPSKAKAEYYGYDVMFLKIPDMHGQSIIIKTEDMLSELGADSQPKKYIQKWSTCVSCIATVGVVSLAGEQLQTNQQINSVIPKERCYKLFNYYLLKSKSEILKTMASGGSATPNLNKRHFESIRIKLPPVELLDNFQSATEYILEMIDNSTREIQTLTALRDTLLPRLINGKVKV